MKTTCRQRPAAAKQSENATTLATADVGKQSMFGPGARYLVLRKVSYT